MSSAHNSDSDISDYFQSNLKFNLISNFRYLKFFVSFFFNESSYEK